MGLTQEQCSLFATLWLSTADNTVPLAEDAAAVSSDIVGHQTRVSVAKELGTLPCARALPAPSTYDAPARTRPDQPHSAWVH